MEASAKTKTVNRKWQKYAYAVFLIAGIYFLIQKDYNNAVVFWGLAPIFDPFDTSVAFGKRPLYQRIWLVIHVLITLTVFALLIINKAW